MLQPQKGTLYHIKNKLASLQLEISEGAKEVYLTNRERDDLPPSIVGSATWEYFPLPRNQVIGSNTQIPLGQVLNSSTTSGTTSSGARPSTPTTQKVTNLLKKLRRSD
jgi:hypothetical protein